MVVGAQTICTVGPAPNWVSPKQGSGPTARHAVTLIVRVVLEVEPHVLVPLVATLGRTRAANRRNLVDVSYQQVVWADAHDGTVFFLEFGQRGFEFCVPHCAKDPEYSISSVNTRRAKGGLEAEDN